MELTWTQPGPDLDLTWTQPRPDLDRPGPDLDLTLTDLDPSLTINSFTDYQIMIDDTKRFSMKVIELYTYFYFLNKDKNYNKNCINSSPSFQMHYKENLYIHFDCKSKHII